MNAISKFGRRYGFMFGLTAAILFFGAWLLTNTLIERAKEVKERANEIYIEARDLEQFVYISRSLISIEDQLANNTSVLMGFHGTKNNGENPHEQIQFYLASHIASVCLHLKEIAPQILNGNAPQSELDKITTEAVSLTRRLANSIDQTANKEITQNDASDKMTAQLNTSIQSSLKVLSAHMSAIVMEIRVKADEDALNARKLADVARNLAFGFYVFAAILAIWGKFIETSQRHNVDFDNDLSNPED